MSSRKHPSMLLCEEIQRLWFNCQYDLYYENQNFVWHYGTIPAYDVSDLLEILDENKPKDVEYSLYTNNEGYSTYTLSFQDPKYGDWTNLSKTYSTFWDAVWSLIVRMYQHWILT